MAGGGSVDVWRVPINKEVRETHFATFPSALIEPCVKAGCPEGGLCLDMFGGSGTVGAVEIRLTRQAVLIELNPQYCGSLRRGSAGRGRRNGRKSTPNVLSSNGKRYKTYDDTTH
jgi:DNA modification methylase